MNIGLAIKVLRKSKTHLNQTEFAEEIGITQTYLSQIETGFKVPSLQILMNIGNFLNVPIQILLWFSLTEFDIPEEKQEHFRFIKPTIDQMIDSII